MEELIPIANKYLNEIKRGVIKCDFVIKLLLSL